MLRSLLYLVGGVLTLLTVLTSQGLPRRTLMGISSSTICNIDDVITYNLLVNSFTFYTKKQSLLRVAELSHCI